MSDTQNLATALAAFQAEMPTVPKTKTAKVPTKSGGSFSYSYADLADVTEAAMPLLAKHGLAFVTLPRQTERGYELVGTLMHTNGDRLEGALPIHGNSPQEWGSSLTYARRYLLGSMTGLVTDNDDDGALASARKPAQRKPRQQQPQEPPAPAAESPRKAGDDPARKKMFALLRDIGCGERAAGLAYVSDVVGRPVESTADLSRAEVSAVIDAATAELNAQRGLGAAPVEDDPANWPPVTEPGGAA